MADDSKPMKVWPTDAGDGSVATEFRWRRMARLWAPTAVAKDALSELQPTLAGGILTIAAGAAWVDGAYCELATSTTLTATPNGFACVRFDPATNAATVMWRDDPSSSGLLPAQQPDGVWEMPIYRMSGGVGTDVRVFHFPQPGPLMDDPIVTNDAAGKGRINFPAWARYRTRPKILCWFEDVVGGMVYPVFAEIDSSGFGFQVLDSAGAPYPNITLRITYIAFADIYRNP